MAWDVSLLPHFIVKKEMGHICVGSIRWDGGMGPNREKKDGIELGVARLFSNTTEPHSTPHHKEAFYFHWKKQRRKHEQQGMLFLQQWQEQQKWYYSRINVI